ncbi:MAG: pantoate--beta-alanine ligase [Pseudomonadales bacterium]|nr:pantoate--beta-alanine ligase [Pseudomonadales bacterium]
MKKIDSVAAFRALRSGLNGQSVGFVPTMGALHIGHASLIDESVRCSDVTVLSIYINPTQFDNANDLAKYPETLAEDLELAEKLGVDYVFMPTYQQMYPDNFSYQVEETKLSHQLCGAHREGHFTGVLTVVMKLLNIVKPDRAYFGEKDYQQFELIKGMVEALFVDVEIVGCPTVRENDGLAFSSRNLNLNVNERKLAPKLHAALVSGLSDEEVTLELNQLGFVVDYIETISGRRFAAAQLGKVRLIDNVLRGEHEQ